MLDASSPELTLIRIVIILIFCYTIYNEKMRVAFRKRGKNGLSKDGTSKGCAAFVQRAEGKEKSSCMLKW
jgi:hypothetical protein